MSKVITVLGGNGYVGRRCVQTLVNNVKDIKVFIVCRSGVIKNQNYHFDDRVEIIKGDALNPDSFRDVIDKSTGFIHSVGTLLDSRENYFKMNKETCVRVARLADELSKGKATKPNFVFVSAQRGLPWPLSIKYSGYLESKRECENELLNCKNIKPVILRPGVVMDQKDRLWSLPLYWSGNVMDLIEKNVINKVAPNLGDKLQLPTHGTELEVLAHYAAAGALGNMEAYKTYSNDFINDKNNLDKFKLH